MRLLGNVRVELSLPGFGRRAVDEEDELLVAGVAELEHGPDLDHEDTATRDLVPLGRLAEVDRQRPVEYDEDLLLRMIRVALAARAGRVAPEVRARARHRIGEPGDRPRVVLAAWHPVELGLTEDRVSHRTSIPHRRAPPRPGRRLCADVRCFAPMRAAIFGRDAELASLQEFIARLAGEASALVLEGEAGMGKTTLWSAGVGGAAEAGLRVLRARPSQSETALSFSGIGDLFDPVLDRVLGCPPPAQRRALSCALVLDEDDGPAADPHAVGVAVLAAVRELAGTEPLVLAIDDVQWLDAASSAALAYAARRLETERVGVLLARRTPLESALAAELRRSLPVDRFTEVDVGPLDAGALHRLVQADLGVALPRPLLREVRQASAGNPFYALEIVRTLQRTGASVEAGQPLPVPESLHDLVHDRLLALPPESRDFLLAAAAHAHPKVPVVEAASGVARDAGLAPPLAAGIVELDANRIVFTHPLLAAGAYETADPLRRAAIHARLAQLLEDPEARAWQLAAAVDEPDETVAGVLEDAARHARSRGAPRPAALLLDRARELTPGDRSEQRAQRGIDAALLHFESGDSRRAEAQLRELIAPLSPGPLRARAVVVLARIRLYEAPDEASALFAQVVNEAGDDRRTLAVAHEGLAACSVWTYERFEEGLQNSRASRSPWRRSWATRRWPQTC